MIGPVSGTGRAMMASLQQAIQKGMPPDQAIQYVKSMATQGVAPLADLYSMMNQFQRLKQQQVQPPQTPPTIRDQLNMAEQQQRMQQMQQAAMNRGLGSMNAGSMENPRFAGGGIVAFQGGGFLETLGEAFGAQSLAAPVDPTAREISLTGIPLETIAPEFEKALLKGDTEKADTLAAALSRTDRGRQIEVGIRNKIAQQKRAAESTARAQSALGYVKGTPAAPAAGTQAATGAPATGTKRVGDVALLGGTGTDFSQARNILGGLRTDLKTEADKTPEQRIAEMEALQQRYGIGEAAKKRGEYLTKREAEAEKDLASDKRMALAQAGFAMAEAASRRGRERTGFLGAAAIGGTTGTKLYQSALKENRAIKDKIAENRFALDQANEMIKAGNIEKGTAQAREAQSNLRALDQARAQSELAIAEFQGRERGADRRLGAQLAAQKERYAQAGEIAQKKLMQGLLEQAPMLIPGFEKLSVDEKAQALQKLLGALAGGAGAMTGLGTIEGIEAE